MDLMNALPGNHSANTVQRAKIDEAVFFTSTESRPLLVTDQSTSRLTSDTCIMCGLRYTTKERLCFLWLIRAERV
jgi:hypothetical protein